MQIRDLASEAVSSIVAKPVKTLLTALGTSIGVAAVVLTVGIASTVSARVSSRFDALRATEVNVVDANFSDNTGFDNSATNNDNPFPADAQQRLEKLNGVVNAGELWTLSSGMEAKRSWIVGAPSITSPVMAATPGALPAANVKLRPGGMLFDPLFDKRQERVAILGSAVADRLGIAVLGQQQIVIVGQEQFTVIGIIESSERASALALSVVIPARTAESIWPGQVSEPKNILIETKPGAAQIISRQAALALRPDQPDVLRVLSPADPRSLRGGVESDLDSLFLLVAIISLVTGSVSIANTTLVSVMERVPEVGLRMALGALPRNIAMQFLAESIAIGLFGGIIGLGVGILSVTAISVIQNWTTVIDPIIFLLAPITGAATGVIAGIYPAVKAMRVVPIAALRRQ